MSAWPADPLCTHIQTLRTQRSPSSWLPLIQRRPPPPNRFRAQVELATERSRLALLYDSTGQPLPHLQPGQRHDLTVRHDIKDLVSGTRGAARCPVHAHLLCCACGGVSRTACPPRTAHSPAKRPLRCRPPLAPHRAATRSRAQPPSRCPTASGGSRRRPSPSVQPTRWWCAQK